MRDTPQTAGKDYFFSIKQSFFILKLRHISVSIVEQSCFYMMFCTSSAFLKKEGDLSEYAEK